MAVKNLGFMMVEQVTATDGLPVAHARSWAHTLNAPYYRLNARMTKFTEIDAKEDSLLVQLMWDTMEYIHTQRATLIELTELVRMAGKREDAVRNLRSEGGKVDFC